MARGERRSLVTLNLEAGGGELQARVQAGISACAGTVERLLGSKSPAPWFQLPFSLRDAEVQRLQDLAVELRANSDVVLILGSPGLESGARALVQTLGPARIESGPILEFIHRDWCSARRLPELLRWLGDRRVSLAVLAGDRPEPLTAARLRVLHQHVQHRHGPAEAARRIVVAGSGGDGFLCRGARERGLRVLDYPLPVPEPYSAMTPAGLLPAALAGVEPGRLVEGARWMGRSLEGQAPASLSCAGYAMARILLAEEGRTLEFLGAHGPPFTALLREAERILALPIQGKRRVPLPRAWSLEQAPAQREPWLEGAAGQSFGTWLSLPTPEGPTIPQDALGDGWPGLEESSLVDLEQSLADAETAAWDQAGLPLLGLRVARLDGLHVGALLFFLHIVRGLSAAWHAPEADNKVALSLRHMAGSGLPRLGAAVTSPAPRQD